MLSLICQEIRLHSTFPSSGHQLPKVNSLNGTQRKLDGKGVKQVGYILKGSSVSNLSIAWAKGNVKILPRKMPTIYGKTGSLQARKSSGIVNSQIEKWFRAKVPGV